MKRKEKATTHGVFSRLKIFNWMGSVRDGVIWECDWRCRMVGVVK